MIDLPCFTFVSYFRFPPPDPTFRQSEPDTIDCCFNHERFNKSVEALKPLGPAPYQATRPTASTPPAKGEKDEIRTSDFSILG